MADIEIEMSKKEISNKEASFEFTTYGEVVECDSNSINMSGCSENYISSEPECIQIEISGLKTLNKFIYLEDTPMYYDNGKFFKVEDNKIVYTDIQWKDITGELDENPELKQEVLKLVEESSKEYTEEAVNNAINIHNKDVEAHEYIQNTIKENYEYLNSEIDLNKEAISGLNIELNNTNENVADNRANIIGLSKYLDDTNQRIDNSNVLISDLQKTTEDNYNELNKLIADNSNAIIQNSENIQYNTDLINQTIENLKEYSKTEEFAKVAFTGEYNDLLNIPSNIATNEYVDQKVDELAKQIVYFDFIIVDELPEIGESNHIYLVPRTQGDKNIYDEYIWIENTKSFEFIGKTEIDLSDYYNKVEVDNILSNKSNIDETGSNIVYSDSILTLNTKDGIKLSEVQIKSAPDVDTKTIHFNNNSELEVIGSFTKDGTIKYDWIGTTEEYNNDLASGLITETTVCHIIDDEQNTVLEGLLYIPKITELDEGFELSWINNQGYDNPNPIIIPKTSSNNGSTSNYNLLLNKPQINDVEIVGNLTLDDLNIASKNELNILSNKIVNIESEINNISVLLDEINGEEV